MAQIINITSEALQATIRRLLPSQQGFGEDLQASNVITPIIDLTPSAEGSDVPTFLQQAISFDDATAFNVTGTATTIVSSTGFWRVIGTANLETDGTNAKNASLQLSDGLSTKNVWQLATGTGYSANRNFVSWFDLVIFLTSGDSLIGTCTGRSTITGSVRQIADVNGELINPTGFTPQ